MKTLDIFGAIGDEFDGATDAQIAAQLEGHNGPLTVRVNSPGGLAHHGIAIYNLLKPYEPTIEVIGMAASAASVILMAGKNRRMATGATVMTHAPWGLVMGNLADIEEYAQYLDTTGKAIAQIYDEHAGGEWGERLGKTVWYTAQEAIDAGLADEMVDRPAESPTDDAASALAALGCDLPQGMSRPDEIAVAATKLRLAKAAVRQTRLRTAPVA